MSSSSTLLVVVPGQRLDATGIAGPGTYEHEGLLFSSLVGTVDQTDGAVSVIPYPVNAARSVLPSVDQVVIGIVSKITAKYAAVEIRAIEHSSAPGGPTTALPEPFRATIRSQDTWPEDETRLDQSLAQISLSFAPGDLVRAKIIGVGDASAGFLLSTGMEPRFGVVFARSAAAGEPMVPVSWKAMVCSKTGTKEPRKCARPE